ncbi:hypothetical protein MMC13_004619 [Lambiella insularis]|nr:hypothetical protein [Lambiella insularis]
MDFWNAWQLWEKLCFVLACGIVVTVLAGCVKLVYKHFQLRKHTAIAAKKKEEQQMQQITVVRVAGAPDIPFGIRAIERGVEVEGVWISRSNTPSSSRQGSPAPSVVGDRSPVGNPPPHERSTKTQPTLAMPQAVLPFQSRPAGSNVPSPGTSESQKERSLSTTANDGSSPDIIKIRIRPTYQPRQSSHLRFSSGDGYNNSVASDPDNEQEEGSALSSYADTDTYTTSTVVPKAHQISSTTIDHANDQHHYVPQRPGHMRTSSSVYSASIYPISMDQAPFSRHSFGDIDSLASHRKSHAAEISRILPRVRGAGAGSGDWTSVVSSSSDRDYYSDDSPPKIRASPKDAFKASIRSDIAEPPSFQSFLESDPQNVKRQSAPLLGTGGETSPAPRGHPLQSTDANRQSKQHEVIRTVNAGFEILRPGTLGTPKINTEAASVKNYRSPRKLHRKTRSDSTTWKSSHFAEEV